jgi:hypothetical protein
MSAKSVVVGILVIEMAIAEKMQIGLLDQKNMLN